MADCPICGSTPASFVETKDDRISLNCWTCGNYRITQSLAATDKSQWIDEMPHQVPLAITFNNLNQSRRTIYYLIGGGPNGLVAAKLGAHEGEIDPLFEPARRFFHDFQNYVNDSMIRIKPN